MGSDQVLVCDCPHRTRMLPATEPTGALAAATAAVRSVLRQHLPHGLGQPDDLRVDRPNVELQVVPFDIGYYMGQSHDYTLFGYDTNPPVDIVYLERHDGGEYVDDTRRTPKYQTLWEQQKAAAMGPEQTRRFLLELAASS